MKQVACTSHIGRTAHDKNSKNTSIQTAGDLGDVERHNNHEYGQADVERMQSNIDLSLKHENTQYDRNLKKVDRLELVDTVKEMYHEEFDQAVVNYNFKQIKKGKANRCIDDYFDEISTNKKQEVAVEGLIQVGEIDDWKGVPLDTKKLLEPIYIKALKAILEDVPGFKLAGASFHVNEGSPHLHYVGICVDDTMKKTGMEKRIGKAAVFTREVLSEVLQDKVRAVMEPEIKALLGWEFKEKQTGRNKDLEKNQYVNDKLQMENKELENQVGEKEERKASLDQQIAELERTATKLDHGIQYKEERIRMIESLEEYEDQSQELYDDIKDLQLTLHHLEDAKNKKLFKSTKDADDWIDKMRDFLMALREQIERRIREIKYYEKNRKIKSENQYSPALEERIKEVDQNFDRLYVGRSLNEHDLGR